MSKTILYLLQEYSLLEELDGEGILLEESSGSDMFTCHLGVVQSDEQVSPGPYGEPTPSLSQ